MVLPEQEDIFFELNLAKGFKWEKRAVNKDSYKFYKVNHHIKEEVVEIKGEKIEMPKDHPENTNIKRWPMWPKFV